MDNVTVSIAIGLVISLLFTEFYGLSAGGMIVPGYLALHLRQPLPVLLTLLTAALTFGAVRLLARFAIIYGRRRIVMMILFGFLFGWLLRSLPVWIGAWTGGEWVSAVAAGKWSTNGAMAGSTTLGVFCVVGYIIPGLIALWMDRQGWVETWAPLLTSSVVVRLVLILIGMEALS
jgi:poly-gamma-glutamate biosynthesis protein PgsC/CapC